VNFLANLNLIIGWIGPEESASILKVQPAVLSYENDFHSSRRTSNAQDFQSNVFQ